MSVAAERQETQTQPLSTEAFVEELLGIVDSPGRNRLEHPFVLAVLNGTATKDQIAGWLNQFSRWADPCNKFIGDMWSNCPDDDLREGLLENMLEEEYGKSSETAGHMRLIDATIRELGWSEERRATDITQYESWAFRHWLEVIMRQRPFVEAICATSFTAERMNTFVFGKIEKGLLAHYDLSEKAMMSVSVHASHIEEEHATLGPIAIERYATTARDQEQIRFVVDHTAMMYYRQYDVWKHY